MSPDGRWCRSSGCDGTDFHLGGGLGEGGGGVFGVGLGREGTGRGIVGCFVCFGIPVFGVCVWIWDRDIGVNVSMSMAAYRLGR